MPTTHALYSFMAADSDDLRSYQDARCAPGGAPAADEDTSNGVDDDCDGAADDLDGDGGTTAGGDRDDDNGWVGLDAVEMCDGTDNDCDDVVDEDCEVLEGDTAGDPKSGCSTSALALTYRRRA